MSNPIHILSLGAGTQSSTLALMAARGEVGPMPAAAIFADTQAEPPSVYRWLDWLEKQLPFPVHRVTAGSLTERITTTRVNRKTGALYYSNMIPAFTLNPDGTKGIVGRSCTSNFKIVPIMKKARQLGGIRRGQKTVGVVQWIGISLDEVYRMKPSRDPWAESIWPLIELRMTRHDCLRWMERNGYPTPPPFRLQLLPVSFGCRMAQVEDPRASRVRPCRRGGEAVAGRTRFNHHTRQDARNRLPSRVSNSARPSGLLD